MTMLSLLLQTQCWPQENNQLKANHETLFKSPALCMGSIQTPVACWCEKTPIDPITILKDAMKNKSLWNQVCVTDPAAVKPITGKQYKGNSPKPYWIIERATETFGPCGIGWGVEVVNERFERFSDTESLHIALVRVWFKYEGERGQIEQMGQTRSSYTSGQGKFIVDEDAPKKSVTDGMVKCLSMLGFAGDIFSGMWDDSKYIEWAAEETRKRENPKLNDEQVNEIKKLLEGRDFEAFMKWVNKCTGQDAKVLCEIPADAYKPIIKLLTKTKGAAE